jgi:hypothetical protein
MIHLHVVNHEGRVGSAVVAFNSSLEFLLAITPE